MSTNYAETRQSAIRNADAAAHSLFVRPNLTEEEALRAALINAHHAILNQEDTIARLRELTEGIGPS